MPTFDYWGGKESLDCARGCCCCCCLQHYCRRVGCNDVGDSRNPRGKISDRLRDLLKVSRNIKEKIHPCMEPGKSGRLQ